MIFNELTISDSEFNKISETMYKITGVLLKPIKKPLVINRLRSRIEQLGLKTFAEYIPLIEKPRSEELEFFINLITTNETFFFRHDEQFKYLQDKILPELESQKKDEQKKEIKIWSAASSTGEEPYTLAIVLKEYFKIKPDWSFKIFASDINSTVIAKAKEARFPERSIKEMDSKLFKKYFKDVIVDDKYKRTEYQLNNEIISSVTFFQHNLLTAPKQLNIDVVFLRNVMIYFDQKAKQKTIDELSQAITPNGYIIVSLAETLNDVKSNFDYITSGIYKKNLNKIGAQ